MPGARPSANSRLGWDFLVGDPNRAARLQMFKRLETSGKALLRAQGMKDMASMQEEAESILRATVIAAEIGQQAQPHGHHYAGKIA